GGTFFASSGSTGTPTHILFSHAMHQRWFALFESRLRNWAGVNSFIPRGMIGGRRVLSTAQNKPPFYRYNYFEKQVYFSAYHINPDAGIIEVLDEHLEPVKVGMTGTVYCTGFLNYDQPLIRYNIGDEIVLSLHACTCGRAMPVVDEIIGRIEDIVIGKDGRE